MTNEELIEPKTEDLLYGLETWIDAVKHLGSWGKWDEMRYQNLRTLIENKPKVDEKFIEKWAGRFFSVFSGNEYMSLDMHDEVKAMLKEADVEVVGK